MVRTVISAGVALFLITGNVHAQQIAVQVNGEPVHFAYAQPTQVAGRVMIPLRGVLERLGADRIDWRPANQEVHVSGVKGDIQLRIGDRTAHVDRRDVPMDVPPMIIQGTTMVPLRFVSETMGARVDWMPQTQTVYIATPTERIAGSRQRYPSDNIGVRPAPRERDASVPNRQLPQDRTGQVNRQTPLPRDRTGQVDREPRLSSPDLLSLFPQNGARINSSRAELFAQFRPNARIDFNTVRLWINGGEVTRDAQITTEGVRFQPSEDMRRGRNDVRLTFRDSRGVTTTQDWYFYVP